MIAKFIIQKETKSGLKKRIRKINLNKYKINWEAESKSKFQKRVKDFLYPYWKNNFVCEECIVAGTRFTFDIYNHDLEIVIECQGQQHSKHIEFFHGKGVAGRLNFAYQLKRDTFKIDFCDLNDILFVEVYEKDRLSSEFFGRQGVIL